MVYMNILLVSSIKDEILARQLEQAFAASGFPAITYYPDLASEATLPVQSMRLMQEADYFLFLVTPSSENSCCLRALTADNLAPLCAAGVKVILIVGGEGSLPAELAFLPAVFFQDCEMLPALLEGFVSTIALVDSVQPKDLYDLRYGLRDLEAFLETAQGLAMAYTGLSSVWDEMQESDFSVAKALFHRYASDVSFGVNFISHARLEACISQQEDYHGPITGILAGYHALERNWRDIEAGFNNGLADRASILAARCNTAAFVNMIYLIMAIKLQPYCDQYLHMHGLKQKQDMNLSKAPPADPAQERISFLMAISKQK